uniref:Pectate lyase superfamily protein domain-containing protein n=1 Tax=Manihot esculenta TaxID=3983 RepID=A0A2C9U3U3_MANES
MKMMTLEMYFSLTSLLFLFVFASRVQSVVFDVKNYGCKADGKSDISKALLGAWKEACSAKGSNRFVVPKGIYSIGLTDLNGPCKGAMELQVQGTLLAPINPSKYAKDSWITFAYIDQFKLSGGGTFDGQEQVAWKQNNCGRNPKCKRLPVSLRFDFITNNVVHDVISLDSKNFHVNVLGGKNLTFDRLICL